jgi:hypothetical protein
MNKRPPHRWFHALVVTGASLTACGGQTDDAGADASGDTATVDGGGSVDAGPPNADAGIIIVGDVEGPPPNDTKNDPRCCFITN